MVSKTNQYQQREAENHRLKSQKHAENAEKLGFNSPTPGIGLGAGFQQQAMLKAQPQNDAHTLCSTENKRVYIAQ